MNQGSSGECVSYTGQTGVVGCPGVGGSSKTDRSPAAVLPHIELHFC